MDFSFNNVLISGSNEIIYVENLIEGNGLGVVSTGSEHDWRVDISPASDVFALGMTIRGNGTFDDSFIFLDTFGANMGIFPSPSEPAFLGIISDDRKIGQFVYNDSTVPGGRVLLEISVGQIQAVPNPQLFHY